MVLRVHPRVSAALHRWWQVALRATEASSPESHGSTAGSAEVQDVTLDYAGYSAVLMRLYRVMMEDFDPEKAAHDVENDWRDDAKGATAMTRSAFGNALFMLADLWTDGMTGAEYEGFLNYLFDRITCVDAQGRHVWRPEAECTFDSRFKQADDDADDGGRQIEQAAHGELSSRGRPARGQGRTKSHGLSRRVNASRRGHRPAGESSVMRASKKLQAAVRGKKARKTTGLRKKAAAIIAASSRVRAMRAHIQDSSSSSVRAAVDGASEATSAGRKNALKASIAAISKLRALGQPADKKESNFNDAMVRYDLKRPRKQGAIVPKPAYVFVQASVATPPASTSNMGWACLVQNGLIPVAALGKQLEEMADAGVRTSRTRACTRATTRYVEPVRPFKWQRPATRLLLEQARHEARPSTSPTQVQVGAKAMSMRPSSSMEPWRPSRDERLLLEQAWHDARPSTSPTQVGARAMRPSASMESWRPSRNALSGAERPRPPLSHIDLKRAPPPELPPMRRSQQPHAPSPLGPLVKGDYRYRRPMMAQHSPKRPLDRPPSGVGWELTPTTVSVLAADRSESNL